MRELAPSLWRWTAPHPAWTPAKGGPGGWEQLVGSVGYAPAADPAAPLVLVDPIAPRAGTPDAVAFWAWLDAEREAGRRLLILRGNGFHARSTDAIRARYGAHAAAGASGDCALAGLRALPIEGLDGDETAYLVTEHGALVFADAVIGVSAHEVRVAPPSWAADAAAYVKSFRRSLARLLDLPWDRLLPSHGPTPAHGRRALEAALSAPAWGE